MGSSISTSPDPALLPVNGAAAAADEPKRLPRSFSPIAISGSAGVGKNTLIDMLVIAHPGLFVKSVSHTTRLLREGEKDGREYHQVTKQEFSNMYEGGELLEWTWYDEELYGTSKKTISADAVPKGKIVVLDIDMFGIDILRKKKTWGAPRAMSLLRLRIWARSRPVSATAEQTLKAA